MSDNHASNSQIEQDKKIILEEMKKIEELDASIHDLELQIQKGIEDLSKEQLKNRERLRDLLLSAPPENPVLSKNTIEFLSLHNSENIGVLEEDCEDNRNMTDEEKKRISELIEDDDCPKEINPYLIPEDMQNILATNNTDESD